MAEMVGMGRAEMEVKVPRREVRNWAVLGGEEWLADVICGAWVKEGRVLLLCEGCAFFEVCACAERCVDLTGEDQGPGWAGGAFIVDAVYFVAQLGQ